MDAKSRIDVITQASQEVEDHPITPILENPALCVMT